MKTGQSDHYPEIIVKSAGLNQIRYDVQPFTKKEMDGKTISGYSYKYVELDKKITKSKLISAIIRNEYSEDDELALIHNALNRADTNPVEHAKEYGDYQNIRKQAKQVAINIMKIV